MATNNRPSVKTRNTGVATGIDKHITSSLMIGGVTYTPDALKAVFTKQNAALDAADALHKQWQDQVQVAHTATVVARVVYQSLRGYLVGQYGSNAKAILNDFGMSAPKPKGPKTVKTKSVAVAKNAATRTARHTMGKKQKMGVKGAVPTTAPTTPSTGSQPVAQSPAASAPPQSTAGAGASRIA